ncbi:hypothetical protein B0T11DRAFT_292198 [Plectosphaerella cucumerina]|uniref:Sfi1 spindle body domain-containing protein n=1 Tax=Plectosphaerella cucumerina TaxID=40658 RepID=A0A8K0X042_9PEZI|nr:hypothetical protein B0T11DRAFT_292198 [Plectosphaerella cucumerina]
MAAWQDLLICHEHAMLLRRHRLLRGVLYHWELMRRGREYAIGIADEDVRRVIARWQTLGQRRVPVQRDIYRDRHGAEVSVRRDGSYVLAATWRHNLLRDSLSKWQFETSGHAGLWQKAASLSTAVSTYRAICSWHGVNREVDTLQVWASRADRYLVINECLGRARHIARPSWSHTTRTLYARARWRQKHLNVRRIVSSWKRQTRSRDRLDAVARDCEVDSSARRLIQTLHAWQEECEGLLASDWTSHLPGSWINEWAVADELLQLLRDESSAAWEVCLRSKIYNKWRALSVQFHSQSYVVSDVVEKNSRKLTRRILLHWQQSGSGTAHSLASRTASRSTHNPRTSIWSRTQTRPTAASSLMDFGGVQSLEESSLYNAAEHHGLLDTPTRWTGLGSSLTRLPTTTPRAPLSTPFERELRTRYNQTNGAGPSGLSTSQTPRLSAADARRIAEERRRNRPS